MSTIEKSIQLYAWKTNYQTFHVVQGEANSRKFNIQLFDTAIPVDLTNCTVMFYAVKPDSTEVYIECEVVDAENGLASVTLTDQMCVIDGTVDCWVQVIGEGGTDLRFEGMNIEVSPCPMTVSVESSNEIKAFLQQSAKLAAVETEVKNARVGKSNLHDKQVAQDRALTDTATAIRQEITVERCRIDNIVNQSNGTGVQTKLLVGPQIQISNKQDGWTCTWKNEKELNSIKTKHPFVVNAYFMEVGSSNIGLPIDFDMRYSYRIDISSDVTISVFFTNNNIAAENEEEKTYNVVAYAVLGYDCDVSEENNELADLRVDVDGKAHESAGSAVRAQIQNILNSRPQLDSTLTEEGKAAPANLVGQIKEHLECSFNIGRIESVNLYNVASATQHCYLNPVNGNTSVRDTSNFVTSDYIEVQPNLAYTAVSFGDKSNTFGVTICFYAEDKSFISSDTLRSNGTANTTSPITAKYARISAITKVMMDFELMLICGTDVPVDYSPYISPKTGYILNDKSVTEKNTTFISVTRSKNIIGSNFGKNLVRTDDGKLSKNEQYTNTDYIPVAAGHVYVLSQYGVASKLERYALYTDTKTYVQNSGKDNDDNAYITIPSGASFIRICRGNYVDLSDGFQFEEVASVNDAPTFYQKPGEMKRIKRALLGRPVDYSAIKWDCLGDSFTDGSPRYHTYISARTGIKVKNNGLAGSTVAKYTAGQNTSTFIERLENLDLTSDIISIFGGIDDAQAILSDKSRLGTMEDKPNSIEEANTFYGAYRYLIEYLKNKAPQAIIFAIVPPKLHSATGGDYENADRYIPQVRKAILDLCEEYAVPVVDLYLESGISKMPIDISTWYRGDKDIHLNNKGQNKISSLIESKLKQLID